MSVWGCSSAPSCAAVGLLELVVDARSQLYRLGTQRRVTVHNIVVVTVMIVPMRRIHRRPMQIADELGCKKACYRPAETPRVDARRSATATSLIGWRAPREAVTCT